MGDEATPDAGSTAADVTPAPQQGQGAQVIDLDGQIAAARAEMQAKRNALPGAEGEQPEVDEDGNPVDPQVDEPDVEEKAKATPWAKQIKADLEKAQGEVARYQQAERAARAEVRKVTFAHEDAKADAAFWQSLAVDLEKLMNAKGIEIDPLALELRQTQYKLEQQQRHAKRGATVDTSAQRQQIASAIEQRVTGLVGKFPEMDPKTNAEAREFLRECITAPRLKGETLPQWLDRLERKVTREARTVRAELAEKQRQKQGGQTQQKQGARTSPAGMAARGTSAPGVRPSANVDDEIAQWKRARAAKRAAR